MRVPLLAVVFVTILAGCGPASTPAPTGVATDPANLPGGGALHNVSPSPGGTATPQTSGVRTVLAPLGLNLRSAASTTAQVLGTVAQGTVFTVLGYDPSGSGWYRVKGDTTSGWITANPQFSSPHRFVSYQSPHGFTALYLETWTFAENPNSTVLRPQGSGGEAIVVQTGANLAALGPAGRDGYTQVSTDSAEVFGVTGVYRIYNRTGTVAASPGPDSPPPLTHLAEIRLAIDSSRAMRLDFAYDDPADLPEFTDFYNSIDFPPPATPGPPGSPGASASPAPSASPT